MNISVRQVLRPAAAVAAFALLAGPLPAAGSGAATEGARRAQNESIWEFGDMEMSGTQQNLKINMLGEKMSELKLLVTDLEVRAATLSGNITDSKRRKDDLERQSREVKQELERQQDEKINLAKKIDNFTADIKNLERQYQSTYSDAIALDADVEIKNTALKS
eukprot:CAMPEP_0168414190 /NCGR_PEP_ID=MMETSP0228-20121227/29599_1 /TAXON_ID=133427 /ORGANISM="Protoceratium reticulatum, Strain CCCM 535 (=CCMP 1889)" /LENGTH=162 /DNA_ID=CAMNT_0008427981 /DNA_START=87 /DNA_END=575 /DNA_ORIENTATION=+